MAVIFESTIKLKDDKNSWYIELRDTFDNKVEICNNLQEYNQKVEQLGEEYGGHIDEVKWFKDEDVLPHFIDEIRIEMAKIQADIEEETGKPLIKEG